MFPSSAPRLRVAICGAGIGGLVCALALSRCPDIEVDVYEAASQFGEVGAGVSVFPRMFSLSFFRALDTHPLDRTLEDSQMVGRRPRITQVRGIETKEGPVNAMRYRKSDQDVGTEFYSLITHGSLVSLHRPDFQKVLLRHLPKTCRTYCKKRLRSYSEQPSGLVHLMFEDGTTATCDILIGADGLKSSVRAAIGTVAYRALIPSEKLRAQAPHHAALKTPTQYLGKNGFVIAYPISRGKMINFVAFTMRHDLENTSYDGPWMVPADVSSFAGAFQHWEPEVQMLIKCVERPLQWAVHTVKPMKSFVSGRVALLGDAAHAMCPHQGSGAGQAMEDAYILYTVLSHRSTHRGNLERALSIYDAIRRPAALRVQERSRLAGQYFTFSNEGMPSHLDRMSETQQWDTLQQLGKKFTKNWEWAWATSVDSSVQEALRLLEAQ
ncbi:FAD/NAD(P)-binding domain-containing protein [Hymenopellis radicata]|nr:FAD/NAD(P)-binding domain-containing protein [Hymenopellis radicata]